MDLRDGRTDGVGKGEVKMMKIRFSWMNSQKKNQKKNIKSEACMCVCMMCVWVWATFGSWFALSTVGSGEPNSGCRACAASLLPANHLASPAHSSVNYGSGGGDWGSQACTESILSAESPPQPSWWHFECSEIRAQWVAQEDTGAQFAPCRTVEVFFFFAINLILKKVEAYWKVTEYILGVECRSEAHCH